MTERNNFSSKIIVCSHHRCGTVLLRNVFTKFSSMVGLSFNKESRFLKNLNSDITQNTHSDDWGIIKDKNSAILGFHIYRNPYDMLLSHVKYHQRTKSPQEACNIIKIGDYTYQDHLKSIENLKDKAIFEIDNIYGRTLRKMLNWDYSDKRFINIDLDDFAADELIKVRVKEISEHFGFSPEFEECLFKSFEQSNRIYKDNVSGHITKEKGIDAEELLGEDVLGYLHSKFPEVGEFLEAVCVKN